MPNIKCILCERFFPHNLNAMRVVDNKKARYMDFKLCDECFNDLEEKKEINGQNISKTFINREGLE